MFVRFGRLSKALHKADKQTFERFHAVDPLLARKTEGQLQCLLAPPRIPPRWSYVLFQIFK